MFLINRSVLLYHCYKKATDYGYKHFQGFSHSDESNTSKLRCKYVERFTDKNKITIEFCLCYSRHISSLFTVLLGTGYYFQLISPVG